AGIPTERTRQLRPRGAHAQYQDGGMMTIRSALLLCVLVRGHTVAADAQTCAARPVKIIVPTGPGAATDVMARLMADAVTRGPRQPVVVENNASAPGLREPPTPR